MCNSFVESDVCNPNPCQNGGTCREENNAAVCACSQQFEGKVCEGTKQKISNKLPFFCFLVPRRTIIGHVWKGGGGGLFDT